MKKYVIAIDGPAGAGKSTISKIIANKLGFAFIKTGEMYRSITYKIIKENIDINDVEKIEELLKIIDLKFIYNSETQIAILDGININDKLNTKEVTSLVSQVSSIKEVRDKVLEYELNSAEENNIVMEGRDIGTVIFPNADVKIFLTCSVEERAKRRYKQNKEAGIEIPIEEIIKNIEFRDKNDTEKANGAMKVADDAITIDSTEKNIYEVTQDILNIVKEKIGDIV